MESEKRRLAYIYIAPAALWLLLFMGFPIVEILKTSLYHTSYKGETFVGIKNYSSLVTDDIFLLVLKNTAVWTVLAVFMNVVAGLAAALLLSRSTILGEWIRGSLLLAWATPLVDGFPLYYLCVPGRAAGHSDRSVRSRADRRYYEVAEILLHHPAPASSGGSGRLVDQFHLVLQQLRFHLRDNRWGAGKPDPDYGHRDFSPCLWLFHLWAG